MGVDLGPGFIPPKRKGSPCSLPPSELVSQVFLGKSEPSKLANLLKIYCTCFSPLCSSLGRMGRKKFGSCGWVRHGERLHEMQIGVMMGGHDCMTDQWPVAHIPMASSCGGSSLPLFPCQ
ncbi:hypothetical protein SEVIR_4G291000v4 [Setaria viridis]|uniref:Uncharacterized protein n=2 Tax=Setaria TaxID=4554 RepID=A0A368QZ59_SETIT|nr:hypothetical protein SETIT_4G279200v2 [Setaria italica]TKW23422.1 hypothetical protein SEVIR_4G291000v2 [Setaria viridis]